LAHARVRPRYENARVHLMRFKCDYPAAASTASQSVTGMRNRLFDRGNPPIRQHQIISTGTIRLEHRAVCVRRCSKTTAPPKRQTVQRAPTPTGGTASVRIVHSPLPRARLCRVTTCPHPRIACFTATRDCINSAGPSAGKSAASSKRVRLRRNCMSPYCSRNSRSRHRKLASLDLRVDSTGPIT